ncbi:hypothetical protein [Duganella lactea]|uniref:hypothetical protein n=1 Tax=Duganella lactea TaxID=2692173 RepID=UPI00353171BF
MLKNLSIKKKLASGFGIIVALIVLLEAKQIETAMVQIQSSTRGDLLTGDATALQHVSNEEVQSAVSASVMGMDKFSEEMRRMMQLNDATQQTVESLKSTSEATHQRQYAAGGLQTSVAPFLVGA